MGKLAKNGSDENIQHHLFKTILGLDFSISKYITIQKF